MSKFDWSRAAQRDRIIRRGYEMKSHRNDDVAVDYLAWLESQQKPARQSRVVKRSQARER